MGNLPSRLTRLTSYGQADAQAVGGKAANLMALNAAGRPVPAAFVVPVGEYERFLDSNSLRAEIELLLSAANLDDERALSECSSRIKSAIASGQMAPPLLEATASAAAPTAGALWAVRSSAVSEDLAEASFAGQQDTYLGVSSGELAERAKQCWASYWNERAIAYRHKAGVPQLAGLITETGGIPSHGAVVSREYGIPAVKGAKQIFKTGQRITVDGNDGVIYLLEE